MSKEFEELKRKAEQDKTTANARRKESYQYARSLGIPFGVARRLQGSSKERILRLSQGGGILPSSNPPLTLTRRRGVGLNVQGGYI